MSSLYKDSNDFIYSVDIKTLPNGKVKIQFSCDGGKFGTNELLDEYEYTVKELLTILQKEDSKS